MIEIKKCWVKDAQSCTLSQGCKLPTIAIYRLGGIHALVRDCVPTMAIKNPTATF
jgi:hypothetical protein